MTSICVVSGADQIRFRSYVNHTIYTQVFDLDYRLDCPIAPGIVHPSFFKMAAVRRELSKYDWVVWVDDDCYFTNFESDNLRNLINQAESEGKSLIAAEGIREPNGMWTTINAGVLAVKNTPVMWDMLEHAVDENLPVARKWWDNETYGVFTGGDQEVITWWIFAKGHQDDVLIVGHREFNSRPHHYRDSLHDAFIVHFCGYPDRVWGVVRFANQFGIGQDLVPEELLERFSVKNRKPVTNLEFKARDLKMRARSKAKATIRAGARKLHITRFEKSFK